jgi:hypothetical protein
MTLERKRSARTRTGVLAVAVLGAAAVAACASTPAPTQRMVDAQASLRGAEEVGAGREPQAQLHARLAEENIQRAKVLMQNGDNKRAEYVLVRAKADADLALANARDRQAKVEADRAAGELDHLQTGPTPAVPPPVPNPGATP